MNVTLGVTTAWRHVASDALEQVEMLNVRRTHNLLQTDKLGDRSHLATLYLHEDILQRLWVEAIFRRSRSHDAIDLTKLVEVANICTTAESTQRVEYICRRHTGAVALGSIDVNLILRETL